MKKVIAAVIAALLTLALTATAQEKKTKEEKKAPAEVTIVGEVIDSRCYLILGAGGKGDEHRQCAIDCAKGGIPLAVLEDKTNNVYFVGNGNDPMKGANEMLIDYAAQKVSLTGKLYEKGGAKMVIVKSVQTPKTDKMEK